MSRKYSEAAKQILGILAVAGVVVVVAAAPGVVLAAKLFQQKGRRFPQNPVERKQIVRSLRGLQKRKFIEIKKKNGKIELRLTKEGKFKFKEIQLDQVKIGKSTSWDKKWRVVAFDIPENTHSHARVMFRDRLKEWGFYQLQKSVWICPWPCENEVQLAAELYDITSYTNIIIAEEILHDTPFLKEYFHL